MIQALTLDLIYLKLLIVHIQLMTLKSFEPWYAMNVLFENTRFSLCINIKLEYDIQTCKVSILNTEELS